MISFRQADLLPRLDQQNEAYVMTFRFDESGRLIVLGPLVLDRDFRTDFFKDLKDKMESFLKSYDFSFHSLSGPNMGSSLISKNVVDKYLAKSLVNACSRIASDEGCNVVIGYPSSRVPGGGVYATIKMSMPHIRESSLRRSDLFNTLNDTTNVVKFEAVVRKAHSGNGWLNEFHEVKGAVGHTTEASEWFQTRLGVVLLSHDDHSNIGSTQLFKSILFADESEAKFNMEEVINGVRSLDFVESVKEESRRINDKETKYYFTVVLNKNFR